jgi:hypothetical protein
MSVFRQRVVQGTIFGSRVVLCMASILLVCAAWYGVVDMALCAVHMQTCGLRLEGSRAQGGS